MMRKFLLQVTLGTIALALNLVGTAPVANAAEIVSRTGHLRIAFSTSRDCFPNQPAATYTTAQGVAGVLYPDCNWNAVTQDVFNYRFVDTRGQERCQGQMSVIYGGRDGLTSVWRIEGAVPGYRCSGIGQTFSVEGMQDQAQSSTPLNLEAGAYSDYSRHIIIVRSEDRACYVGLSRQSVAVSSLRQSSTNSNLYQIEGRDLSLLQTGRRSFSFGGHEYTWNPEYDLRILDSVPEAQDCLRSTQPYYQLIENRFR